MKTTMRIAGCLILTFLAGACGTSGIKHLADESYRIKPDIGIEGKLALFSVMAAGSSSLNNKSDTARIAEAPYSPSRIIKNTEISLPTETSMEGFRNTANDILLAKFKQNKSGITIIPPKQVQAIIGQSDISLPYLEFLSSYNYLSVNADFLKKLGDYLNCRYLMIPQLVIISNINDNSMSFVWAFGNRSSDYSVTILGQIWDMSTGELIWTGRGSSSTKVWVYQYPAAFDQLAAAAAAALIRILPLK